MGLRLDLWPGPVLDPDAPPRTTRPPRQAPPSASSAGASTPPAGSGAARRDRNEPAADETLRPTRPPTTARAGRARRSPDGRVVVDSRLRDRRLEVARDAGRRRLRRISLVAAVLALVAGGYAALRSPLLAVRDIKVVTTAHVDRAEILRASGISDGMAMIDVDQADAVRRLEASPWVDTARVARSWPGTVTVSITERTPVAQLHIGSQWALIDASGRVLAVGAAANDLPVFEGLKPAAPGATLADAAPMLELARAMPSRLSSRVAALRHGGADAALDVALIGGGTIRFGSVDGLDQKLIAAVTMLDHVEAKCLGTIDVQVPNAPTLTPTPACA